MKAYVVINPSGIMDSETLAFRKDDCKSLFCQGRIAGQDKDGRLQYFNLNNSEQSTLWRMYETRGYSIKDLDIAEPNDSNS